MIMVKQKPTLNQADIELLISMMKLHFVTHEEFTQFRSDVMDNFDKLLKNTSTSNDEFLITQSVVTSHTDRLDRIDDTLGLPSLV